MIVVRVFNTHSKYRIKPSGTKVVVRYVLKNECIANADVNVVAIDNKAMINMNGTYLNHWYATDVICFPLSESTNLIEGEIYINIDQARSQARLYKETIKREYARLIVHGALHLIGYKDKTKAQKQRMTELENHYLDYLFQMKNLKL
jgi:probable rRNA maturation factor